MYIFQFVIFFTISPIKKLNLSVFQVNKLVLYIWWLLSITFQVGKAENILMIFLHHYGKLYSKHMRSHLQPSGIKIIQVIKLNVVFILEYDLYIRTQTAIEAFYHKHNTLFFICKFDA